MICFLVCGLQLDHMSNLPDFDFTPLQCVQTYISRLRSPGPRPPKATLLNNLDSDCLEKESNWNISVSESNKRFSVQACRLLNRFRVLKELIIAHISGISLSVARHTSVLDHKIINKTEVAVPAIEDYFGFAKKDRIPCWPLSRFICSAFFTAVLGSLAAASLLACFLST